MPVTGGTYTVNVIASTDNPAVTSLGIQSFYWGALSTILNGNLGNATLGGDVTAQSIAAPLGPSAAGSDGDIGDVHGDSRADLGPVANTSNGNRGQSGSHPWWVVGQSAPIFPNFYANAPTAVLGTFTVTIPAYTITPNSGDFLRYGPNLQVSVAAGNYDFWGEVTSTNSTNRGGKFNTATGLTNVNLGTQVTFAIHVIPEPATIVLLGLGGLGLMACGRPRQNS